MAIVFWILALYGLFFLFLAMTSEGADRWPSRMDTDRPLATPVWLSARTDEPPEVSEKTELAM